MTQAPVLWTSMEATVITGGRSTHEWRATGVALNVHDIRPGDLFFAAPGDDLQDVFLRGAAAAVVAGGGGECGNLPILMVPDVFDALRALARAARFRTHAQVVSVQGQAARQAVSNILSMVFDVYKAGKHQSLSLCAMPEISDFAVFGFSPLVKPDIAVITDCKTAESAVFESMAAGARVLINTESEDAMGAIARARAAGIRNVFTYGKARDADAMILQVLKAANGTRVRMRVLGEAIETILPSDEMPGPEMLAGVLVLKLSEVSIHRIGQAFARPGKRGMAGNNLALMDKLVKTPMQAAFRVINMIDFGKGKRTLVLDNIQGNPQKTTEFSNKDLAIPMRIDNLEFVYACKGLSLFANAESAIRNIKPSAALEKIVPDVLGTGDYLTFEGITGGPGRQIPGAMRFTPNGRSKPPKTGHAL